MRLLEVAFACIGLSPIIRQATRPNGSPAYRGYGGNGGKNRRDAALRVFNSLQTTDGKTCSAWEPAGRTGGTMFSIAYRQPAGNARTDGTQIEMFSSFVGPNELFLRLIVMLVSLRAEAAALQ